MESLTAQCNYDAEVITADVRKLETRCPYSRCNKILFKGILAAGTWIEIQCPKCKNMTILQVVPSEP